MEAQRAPGFVVGRSFGHRGNIGCPRWRRTSPFGRATLGWPFSPAELECYKVTMLDPLSPTGALGARLLLAASLLAALWLVVAWAIA